MVARAKSPQEFPAAFDAISAAKVDGMIVLGDAMLRVNRKPIVDFATASRLPTVYAPRDFVESGGLIAYGVSLPNNFRRSASFVAERFSKGAKPSDLPVEQPTRLTLIINLKAAKAFLLDDTTLPGDARRRGDRVEVLIVAYWHETVMAAQSPHVCCRRRSGKRHLLEDEYLAF